MSFIIADFEQIVARHQKTEADNKAKVDALEDESVKLLRERDNVLKRIRTLQDLRNDQRNMLYEINKLNNVKETFDSVERKTSTRREDTEPNAIKSALKNGNGSSNHFAGAQSEPVSKKAKTKDFDQGSDDFIPFGSNANGYSSSTSSGKTKASAKRGEVDEGRGGGGKADVNQNAKRAIVLMAKENTERRRFVDNPCSYFSQAGSCPNGNRCYMSHDVVPITYCKSYNETGECFSQTCRQRHELFETPILQQKRYDR